MTKQHAIARQLLPLLRRGLRERVTYGQAAQAIGRDPRTNSRAVAQACDLLDAAAAYAKVPLLALIAIREASGEVNHSAWARTKNARGEWVPHPHRDRIIEHSKQHAFRDTDVAAIADALAAFGGLGNRAAWKHVRTSMSRAELYRTIAGLKGRSGDLHKQTEIEEDVREVERRGDLSPTEKEALVLARRGQGKFREQLIAFWGGCAVGGCKVGSVLRASHIKPWRKSTNQERLDPANGLLLTANLDALFNDGLITFEDDGKMLISTELSKEDRSMLRLSRGLRKMPSNRQQGYLQFHRAKEFWV